MVRLRLVLIIMTIITTAVGIAATLQTRTILAAKQHLSAQALPNLMQVQKIKADLNSLLLDFQGLAYEVDLVHLSHVLENVTLHADEVRGTLENLQPIPAMRPIVLEITRLVTVSERIAQNQFQLQSALAQAHQEKTYLLERLEIIESNIGALLGLPLGASSHAGGLGEIVRLLHPFVQTSEATNFRLAGHRFEEALDRFADQLSRIHGEAQRHDFAEITQELRALALGPNGLIINAATRFQLLQSANRNHIARSSLVRKLDDLSHRLLVTGHDELTASSASLTTAARQLVWVLAGALLTVLVLVLLTNTVIIEKQINRRMKRLNKAVTAISRGNLEHPINVHGNDEIGEMAVALAIFKDNAQELRRSNEELEKFAYVAAHDLRSPLRAIRDLSEWTIEDEANELSAESRAYLSLLQSRTDRLSRLLADLLDFARAGHDEPEPQTVSLEALVAQIARTIDPECLFNIRYDGPRAPIGCYLTAITQTLSNLLSNAIKHHDRATGQINVLAWINAGRIHIRVQDDGPGIDLCYQKRIFQLFQTLRPRDEVEGSGLGLAIVGKLVEHYDGSLTVTSDPSVKRGTIFEVDLPVFQLESACDTAEAA